MAKLGLIEGSYEVVCGKGDREDPLETVVTRTFHYTGKPGVLTEEEYWGPAKDKAFDFAERMRKEGYRCRVYHHLTHLVHEQRITVQ